MLKRTAMLTGVSLETLAELPLSGNASAVIYDELHTAKNRELWDVMATSMGARSQPLMIAITTAGVFDTNSICHELYSYGKRVEEGVIEDDTFLPLIYEADPDDDIHDPKVWKKANPNFGISIKPEYFEKMAREAKTLPSSEIAFRQLHLNQWVNSLASWITDDEWMKSAGNVDLEQLKGRKAYAGLDLAAVEDVTAFVLAFPMDDESVKIVPFLFVSEAAVERRRNQTGGSYDKFVSAGCSLLCILFVLASNMECLLSSSGRLHISVHCGHTSSLGHTLGTPSCTSWVY